jgi:hypothetical protein
LDCTLAAAFLEALASLEQDNQLDQEGNRVAVLMADILEEGNKLVVAAAVATEPDWDRTFAGADLAATSGPGWDHTFLQVVGIEAVERQLSVYERVERAYRHSHNIFCTDSNNQNT